MKLTAKERQVVLEALQAYRLTCYQNKLAFQKAKMEGHAETENNKLAEVATAHGKITAEKPESHKTKA